MPSNSLSARRGILARPIVCKKGPPPFGDAILSLTIDDPQPIYTGESYTFVFTACNPAFAVTLLLTPIPSASAGEWSQPEDITNCGDGDNGEWTAPDTPQFVTLGFAVTYPRQPSSTVQIIIQVLPDP